jgi:hypothetical protein
MRWQVAYEVAKCLNERFKDKTDSDPGPKVPDSGMKHWFGLPGLIPVGLSVAVIDTPRVPLVIETL